MRASSGPAFPIIAAKATTMESAHLNAPTAVLPLV